jgi:chemotaxis protein methyltransferase CheR
MSTRETEAIEVQLVLEAIFEKYGYDLRGYQTESMTRRVRAALAKSGLAHLGEFQHQLLSDSGFFSTVLEELTVHVSEMFRDPPFYRVFRERVVPALRTYPEVKIWHAGCASGEEVYATAIMLWEENLYDRAQIYATDVSAGALERAREGVYSATKAASFAKAYAEAGGTERFEDYTVSAYERIAIHDRLRRNVVFFHHNLVSDHALGEMNVIFCRNVLIYFGPSLRDRVLGMLKAGLRRGGFLCLGSGESLPAALGDYFTPFASVHRIYQRRGEA